MKVLHKISGTVVVGMCMAIVGVCGISTQANAQGSERNVAAEKTEKKVEEKVYSYTANAGDSYTQLVRKAVQTYGLEYDKDLGNGRIVAIETGVSERAGWPQLNEGQVVSFSHSLVKTWIDEAMKLLDTDIAAWSTYVPYIDFDTRQIGE